MSIANPLWGAPRIHGELLKLGIEGRNIEIDIRWAAADVELMKRFAKELVALQPDLILTSSTPAAAAMLQQTHTIPIVFVIVADPVGSGFVASLPRPGGNATGFTPIVKSLGGKWVELLKEIAPRLVRVGFLFNPPTAATFVKGYLDAFKAAAASVGAEAIAAPAIERVAISRAGDIWILGRHRVHCGDARSESDLDRLMRGEQAVMVFADPPYNVRIADIQGRGRIKHPEFAFASGEMDESQFIAFLQATLGNAARVSRDDAIHYVCIDWRHVFELIAASRMVYGDTLNFCVWAKTNPGQGSFYRSQHEFVGVFQVGQAGHQNNIQLGRYGRNRSNLWTYAGISGFSADRQDLLAQHPTVKPVALVADAIRDCTTKGDIVLDPFLGSGTTLLAAEKIGRRGYGLEFEPRYVDVAIRRWEKYTKSDAVLDGDGRTFAEIATERLAPKNTLASPSPISPDAPQNGSNGSDQSADSGNDYITLCHTVAVIPTMGKPK